MTEARDRPADQIEVTEARSEISRRAIAELRVDMVEEFAMDLITCTPFFIDNAIDAIERIVDEVLVKLRDRQMLV